MEFNSGSKFDLTLNRFKPEKSGAYFINAAELFNAVRVEGNSLECRVYLYNKS